MKTQSEYTGHLFEEEVIGSCKVRWDRSRYYPYRLCIEATKRCQPKGTRPRVVSLETAISSTIGQPVKFFTAVGTPMDVLHGVDGFFECGEVQVTLDLTLNPHKTSHKADIVFNPNLSAWDELEKEVVALFADRLGLEVAHA